jgi:hypothetical protein
VLHLARYFERRVIMKARSLDSGTVVATESAAEVEYGRVVGKATRQVVNAYCYWEREGLELTGELGLGTGLGIRLRPEPGN